jgi:hypothetical protein
MGWTLDMYVHISENRMIKKVLNTKSERTRKVGRPRLRRKECVWQDVRILGIRKWRSVASNREEWRAILRKARAHTGLSVPIVVVVVVVVMMYNKVS